MTKRDKEIIDLYLNHPELSVKDIAIRYNISNATVSRVARINNLQRRSGCNGTKITKEQIEQIKTQYLNGSSMLSLQKKYNISYDRIKNILKETEKISAAKRINPNLKGIICVTKATTNFRLVERLKSNRRFEFSVIYVLGDIK